MNRSEFLSRPTSKPRWQTILGWQLGEAIAYNSLLFLHNFLLVFFMGTRFAGEVGIIFSSIYLGVSLTLFGLDELIVFYYHHWLSLPRAFLHLVVVHSIATIIVWGASIGLIALTFPALFWHYYPLIISLIAVESMRKIVKGILTVSLRYQWALAAELLLIASFVAMIWGSFFFFNHLTLYFLLCTMLIMATASLIIMLAALFFKPYEPAANQVAVPLPSLQAISTQRITIFINQIPRLFTCQNTISCIMAIGGNIDMIAHHKLIIAVFNLFFGSLRTAFGATFGTLFIHQRAAADNSLLLRQATHALYALLLPLAGIAIFLTATASAPMIRIFSYIFLLNIIDHLLIIHERFLFAHNKLLSFALPQLSTYIAFFLVIYCADLWAPAITLTLLFFLRFLAVTYLIVSLSSRLPADLPTPQSNKDIVPQ